MVSLQKSADLPDTGESVAFLCRKGRVRRKEGDGGERWREREGGEGGV